MNLLKIKNTVFGAMSLALLFTACEPMSDIYDELDQDPSYYAPSVEFTLSADDYGIIADAALETLPEDQAGYAKSVESNLAFNQVVTASEYMKYVLEESYAVLEQGASASITYNTTVKPEVLMQYESADALELSASDYAVVDEKAGDALAFYPSAPAADYMSDVLVAALPDAVEGDRAYVNYYESTDEPVLGSSTIYTYDFEDGVKYEALTNEGGWSQQVISGTTSWEFREFSENIYVQMSAYSADAEAEAYLVSPEISLVDGSELNMDLNFGYHNGDVVDVLISQDYSGDATAATWVNINDQVTFPEPVSGGYAGFVAAGPIDLSSYSGSIHVAFRYVGHKNDGPTTTIQIDNFIVSTGGYEVESKTEYNDIYAFDGSEWYLDSDVLVLDPADYDAMGAPGAYDNFSSSDAPEDYLPTFLEQTMPYAQEDDSYIIAYRYYANRSTTVRADEYTLTNGVWTSLSTATYITETSPFFNSSVGWIFDPTVRFTVSGAQHQLVVDYVKNNFEGGEGYVDSYGTSEYYYGHASYYSNIDMRLSKRTSYGVPLTQDEMDTYGVSSWEEDTDKGVEISYNRLKYGSLPLLLSLVYPDSPAQVFGVDQVYEVTFQTYGNDLAKVYHTYQYTCTKAGPDPEFRFDADITE